MLHFLSSLLLVGSFVFVIAMVHGARILLRDRREEAASFQNYFSIEYDRDLMRFSALSEDQEWQADLNSNTRPSHSRRYGDLE